MPANLRAVPQVMPPQPSQQGWVWNGTNWVCDPCCDGSFPTPPPCPPSGFPTPCPPWFPPPAGQAPWYPGANGGVSFSASPPVNPIRGNFWWDGIMLHLFDGAAWVDIGPGASGGSGGSGGSFVGVSPPLNPAIGTTWWNGTKFQVWDGTLWNLVGPQAVGGGSSAIQFALTCTSARTLPGTAGSWGIVPFNDLPQVDLMNGWDPVQHKWTPTTAGTYIFLIRGFPDAIALVKNDPGTFTSGLSSDIVVAISAQTPPDTWIAATGIAQINGTTDYVRFWARSAASTFPTTGSNPCFSAAML